MATSADPIPLRDPRRGRLLHALLVIAVVILISVALIAVVGQAFAPDPMTGT
jgi:hypothetical protein